MSKSKAIALIAVATASLALTSADTGAEAVGPVAQRQQAMKQMAAAAKSIAAMFRGTQSYDPKSFRTAAAILVQSSGERLSVLFAGNYTTDSSAAADKIAADRQAFDAIAARLEELATVFDDKAARAGDVISSDMRMGASTPGGGSLLGSKPLRSEADLKTVPAEHLFHMMLETCSTCHFQFRVRKSE
jgi:cytochrome c556